MSFESIFFYGYEFSDGASVADSDRLFHSSAACAIKLVESGMELFS